MDCSAYDISSKYKATVPTDVIGVVFNNLAIHENFSDIYGCNHPLTIGHLSDRVWEEQYSSRCDGTHDINKFVVHELSVRLPHKTYFSHTLNVTICGEV